MSRNTPSERRPGEPEPIWRPHGAVRRRSAPARRFAARLLRVSATILGVLAALLFRLARVCVICVYAVSRARSARIGATVLALTGIVLAGVPYRGHEPAQWPFIASPNIDERPPTARVNAIVLHATEINTLAATVGCFRSRAAKVSAHFVVDRDGTVVQMAPVSRRAWHAGRSELGGRSSVNDFSVGIEMVNLGDGKDPYPEAQVRAAALIVQLVRRRTGISHQRIVRHADVARPRGRKVDPLGFDMRAFRRLCREQP